MIKSKKIISILTGTFLTLAVCTSPAVAVENGVERLGGQDRIETSQMIVAKYENPQNIIIADSSNFPDSLSANILSKKNNAPILLTTQSKYDATVQYIKNKIPQGGTVYIAGGQGVIKPEFETKVKNAGYKVKRLGGKDRFETNMLINNEANVQSKTPVFICGAANYPDALSASSVSGSYGYPIILSNAAGLSNAAIEYIKRVQPESIYITGGNGAIDKNVESKVKTLIPSANVERIYGANRYDTSLNIVKKFNSSNDKLCIASGNGFADSVSGSALASQVNANILLVDQELNANQANFISTNKISKVYVFGGTSSVSDTIKNKVTSIVNPGESDDFTVIGIE